MLARSSVLETHGTGPTSRLAGGDHTSWCYSAYNGTGGRNRTFCFRVSDENINRYTTPAYLGNYRVAHSSSEYFFISDFVLGKLYASHHLRIALSVTP